MQGLRAFVGQLRQRIDRVSALQHRVARDHYRLGNVEFGMGYLTTSARAAQGSTITALKKNAPSESIVPGFMFVSVC